MLWWCSWEMASVVVRGLDMGAGMHLSPSCLIPFVLPSPHPLTNPPRVVSLLSPTQTVLHRAQSQPLKEAVCRAIGFLVASSDAGRKVHRADA